VKLLITTGIFPPDIGGPATFIPLLARDALVQNSEVTVVTLGNESSRFQEGPYRVITISRTLPKVLRILKTVHTIFVESKESDAIFSNGLYIETALVLRIRNRKSLAKIVGDPVWEKARNQNRTTLDLASFQTAGWSTRDKLTNLIFTQAWGMFENLTCPSQALVQMVKGRLRGKEVGFIPNGVDLVSSLNAKKTLSLIIVSRLVSWKNIQQVINAAQLLDAQLVIIGDGPEKRFLESHARALNAKVLFTGSLHPEEVEKNLRESKYFLQMSDYEGMSFSLLEAMSFGLVPIVSGNEGNRGVVEHDVNGVICEINGTSIAQAIQAIELDENRYNSLSQEAISTVRTKFNGKANRQKMLDLLEINS
jgi:glycosyltransferase involved in cell wall biosynthesis